jgi:hypothetical protein
MRNPAQRGLFCTREAGLFCNTPFCRRAAAKKVVFLKNSSALRFTGEKIGVNLPHGPKTGKIEPKNEAQNGILNDFLASFLAY